ncbi:MAG: M28 family peptidase [Roseofilum sp. SBFL]|nr:M28 family peptidase [Roseofilum sp. SID3]MBP0023601.1 M28 family peptidase [Roseofilum sp. SID2]MBP0039262.1 M28 family peptidase [Roseofilum sp. SID1]MBP0042724.1 M28 family peptidase [Roseofilum sp. SBFL]
MPGKSYQDALLPLTVEEQALAKELEADVKEIASEPHNYLAYNNLLATAQYLETEFTRAGYQVNHYQYSIDAQEFDNLEVEIPGTTKAEEIIVIGAHYDSVAHVPGANDNGSGAAAVLALARRFAGKPQQRTLKFLEFVNEENPFGWTEDMGSLIYAKICKQRQDNIVGMMSLETMGYYSDKPGSQQYPAPLNLFYPLQGNFIAFVGNLDSGNWVRQVIGSFRQHTLFPSEGAALPNFLPGVGWSDHWSFWQQGYPALMVTDTAPFRYPYYHRAEDTPDKIDYGKLARVVAGLERVIRDVAN